MPESSTSWKRLSAVSVSLAQVVLVTEKRSPPGASRSTTEPTIMAISMYTIEVMAMARNVPLGMAFWGSCTEQWMGWARYLMYDNVKFIGLTEQAHLHVVVQLAQNDVCLGNCVMLLL